MNRSRFGEFGDADVLLDAGPLRTLLVLHFIRQAKLSEERLWHLVRHTRPQLESRGTEAFWSILDGFRSCQYTQLGLAEALQFRKYEAAKQEEAEIRTLALDAIRQAPLVEVYVETQACLEGRDRVVGIVGLTDAIHIHFLQQNRNVRLLTDDERLRQHAGETADRIIALNELLTY